MLVPIKSLSTNREKMDIYEDIDSDLIKEWVKAGNNNDSLEIFLADRKQNQKHTFYVYKNTFCLSKTT